MHIKSESPFWSLNMPVFSNHKNFAMNGKKLAEFSKPPPFVTGGFVGSKSVEHQDKTVEFSILAALVISDIVSFDYSDYWTVLARKPFSSCGKIAQKNPEQEQPKSYADAAKRCIANKLESVDKENTVINKNPRNISMANELDEPDFVSKIARTVSESSDQSWATVEEDETRNSAVTNPWLRRIMGSEEDEEEETDEEEDEDDFSEDESEEDEDLSLIEISSENGEVVDTSKWAGELLSPISSPPPLPERTSPCEEHDSDDCEGYDSDDGEGYVICCGPAFDEEDERKVAEERLREANERWQHSLENTKDEPDLARKKKTKEVHFPSDDKLQKIRPLVVWSHAHRAARKGDWEVLARDSERFRARIQSAGLILDPILSPSHRRLVWNRIHSPS